MSVRKRFYIIHTYMYSLTYSYIHTYVLLYTHRVTGRIRSPLWRFSAASTTTRSSQPASSTSRWPPPPPRNHTFTHTNIHRLSITMFFLFCVALGKAPTPMCFSFFRSWIPRSTLKWRPCSPGTYIHSYTYIHTYIQTHRSSYLTYIHLYIRTYIHKYGKNGLAISHTYTVNIRFYYRWVMSADMTQR